MRHLAPSPRHTLRALACCALSALWVAPGHSWAADDPVVVSVTTTLSNIGYRLVDLDTTDGVTPTISFQGSTFLNIRDQTWDGENGTYVLNSPSYQNGLTPNTTIVYSSGQATATASPDSLTVSSSLRLSDLTSHVSDNGFGNLYAFPNEVQSLTLATSTDPGTFDQTRFTLSANTAIEITGTATVQARIDGSSLNAWLASRGYDGANWNLDPLWSDQHISLVLTSYGTPSDGSSENLSTVQASQSRFDPYIAGTSDAVPLLEFNASAPISLQFVNMGTQALDGGYDIEVAANANAYFSAQLPYVDTTAPIPEPATWALMGLGLAGIGAARRRAKPRAASAR